MGVSWYLPMDCPNCGRRRLLAYDGEHKVKCEKCGATEFDCDDEAHEAGGPHPQHASAFATAT